MAVSFPGPIPIPRGEPMPQMQPQGNFFIDAGEALQQGGKAVDQTVDRWNRLEEMVERRKLAIETQKALEDFRIKDMEFQKAKEETDKQQFTEQEKRMSDRNADIKAKDDEAARLKKEKADNMQNATADLAQWGIDNPGKKISDMQVWQIANKNKVGDSWEDLAMRQPRSPSTYIMRQGDKKNEAEMAIPYLQKELKNLIRDFNGQAGLPYSSTKIITDPMGYDRVLENLPQESEKRRALESLRKAIRKKVAELRKAKVSAKIPYDTTDSGNLDAAIQSELMKQEALRNKLDSLQRAQ